VENLRVSDRLIAGKMSIRAVKLLKDVCTGRAVGIRDNKTIDVPFCDVDKNSINKIEEYESLNVLL